jgi:hypothetical protein
MTCYKTFDTCPLVLLTWEVMYATCDKVKKKGKMEMKGKNCTITLVVITLTTMGKFNKDLNVRT